MNVENFNEKYDRNYVEEAVEIYKYGKFENWFKLLKDIFSYTHNAIYSGGREFHIIFRNKCNSEKIKITVTNIFNDFLVTSEITDENFILTFPWLLKNEVFDSLNEVYYYLMDVLKIITDYAKFTPLALPKMLDVKKKEVNYLRATRYIAGIKYHYKEL
jgi:hypothetical protein